VLLKCLENLEEHLRTTSRVTLKLMHKHRRHLPLMYLHISRGNGPHALIKPMRRGERLAHNDPEGCDASILEVIF
jgi:hypothetical protein